MNYKNLIACGVLLSGLTARAELFLIDTIRVAIFTEEATDIITESDVRRPSLEGAFRSLDDIIFEHLVYAVARQLKALPDEDTVDRHIQTVMRENNLSREQLTEIFRQAGYTFEEGRKQFSVMAAINSVLDFKIRSRLLVPDREIVAWYEEHPEMEELSYTLEKAFIPFEPEGDVAEQKKKVASAVARTSNMIKALSWVTLADIPYSTLDPEIQELIIDLKEGGITQPRETAEGFELYRVVRKIEEHPKSLEKRREEIADILRGQRYKKLIEEYRKELFDGASLLYFK